MYLLARAAFLEQCTCMLDVSRTLGRGPWGSFFEIAVPLARPAIAGGVALALMETLADFGTVQYFGVDTFTTGIYRTWFALGAPTAAAQLAGVLMLFVLLLLTLERASRGLAKYQHTAQSRLRSTYRLSGWRGLLASCACALPVALGFAVPVLVLLADEPAPGRRHVRRHVSRACLEQLRPRGARRPADHRARPDRRLWPAPAPGPDDARLDSVAGLGYAIPAR